MRRRSERHFEMTVPLIETDRLILRPPVQLDFDGWAEFHGDAEAMRFLGGPMVRAAAWRSMASVAGMWTLLGFGQFSVIEKATGRWIGRAGPWMPEGWPGAEIGWMFLRSTWGNGFASEAAVAAVDWAFETLGWTKVIHVIHPQNAASQAVARRLGSALLGPVKLPAPFDGAPAEAWGQSRDRWRGRRKSSEQ
jgi:RimJ/RimL family protein N-acetyltransferase